MFDVFEFGITFTMKRMTWTVRFKLAALVLSVTTAGHNHVLEGIHVLEMLQSRTMIEGTKREVYVKDVKNCSMIVDSPVIRE